MVPTAKDYKETGDINKKQILLQRIEMAILSISRK